METILTPQAEAQQIAALGAWVLCERNFMTMLIDAGLDGAQARICMQEEN